MLFEAQFEQGDEVLGQKQLILAQFSQAYPAQQNLQQFQQTCLRNYKLILLMSAW